MLTAPVRPHDGDLRRREREVDVRANVLARHDVVRAAVRLAQDDGDLRHGGLGEREEQLRAVLDDAAVLLVGPRHEAGHVDERDERDVEAVAEAHEARGLHRRVDVEDAGEDRPAGWPRRPRRARRSARSRRRCSARTPRRSRRGTRRRRPRARRPSRRTAGSRRAGSSCRARGPRASAGPAWP